MCVVPGIVHPPPAPEAAVVLGLGAPEVDPQLVGLGPQLEGTVVVTTESGKFKHFGRILFNNDNEVLHVIFLLIWIGID